MGFSGKKMRRWQIFWASLLLWPVGLKLLARIVSFPTDEEIISMLRGEEQRTIEVEALSADPEEVVSDYKPTKFGQCTTCQYSRKPHLFQSGANAGHIRLECSQWWKLIDGKRQCWTSAPLSDDLWPKISKYLKNQHAKLRASLLRNGNARWSRETGAVRALEKFAFRCEAPYIVLYIVLYIVIYIYILYIFIVIYIHSSIYIVLYIVIYIYL